MTIVPHVCAEFHDRNGAVLFRIDPSQLNSIIWDAPDSIRQDPLYDMLLRDGAMTVTEDKKELKTLENDPLPAAEPEQADAVAEDTAGAAEAAAEKKAPGRKSGKA